MEINQRTKIAFIDERLFVRSGIGLLLSGFDGIELVCAMASVDELLTSSEAQRLDELVVVLGYVGDGTAGERLRRAVRTPAAVIAIGDPVPDCDVRVDPVAGIDGIVAGVRRAATARSRPSGPAPRHAGTAATVSLTSRQLAVLWEISNGRSTAEISRALRVAPKTVEHHKQQMYGRLGVHSRAEAVAAAFRLGVLPADDPAGTRP